MSDSLQFPKHRLLGLKVNAGLQSPSVPTCYRALLASVPSPGAGCPSPIFSNSYIIPVILPLGSWLLVPNLLAFRLLFLPSHLPLVACSVRRPCSLWTLTSASACALPHTYNTASPHHISGRHVLIFIILFTNIIPLKTHPRSCLHSTPLGPPVSCPHCFLVLPVSSDCPTGHFRFQVSPAFNHSWLALSLGIFVSGVQSLMEPRDTRGFPLTLPPLHS